MNWLKKSYINLSAICEMLYGSKDKSQTSKFFKKVHERNGKRLMPDELEKLEQIRKQIEKDLAS